MIGLLLDIKHLHLLPQIIEKLHLLLNLIDLYFLLFPDMSADVDLGAEEATHGHSLLNQSHEEKGSKRLLVWYPHLCKEGSLWLRLVLRGDMCTQHSLIKA